MINSTIIKVKKIRSSFPSNTKIVLVTGNFNVIHPGHLRLLNFASDCGDKLVVGLFDDNASGVFVSANLRLEGIISIGVVDDAFVIDCSIESLINNLLPEIIVKGKEYEGLS